MSTTWFKSTFSGGEQACVAVAHRSDAVLIRDTKLGNDSPIISVPPAQWQAVLDIALSKSSGAVDALTVSLQENGGATVSNCAGIELTYTADEWDAFAKGV